MRLAPWVGRYSSGERWKGEPSSRTAARMKLPNQLIGTVEPETLSTQKPSGSFTVVARLIALSTLGVAGAALYWQARHLDSLKGGIAEYVIVFLAQFSLYLAACYLVMRNKGSLWAEAGRWSRFAALSIVLFVGASVRAELVDQTPYLSSDVYRYIWDGRVQASGINPYRFLPSAPELAHLRDDAIYGHINRREFAHTIYPPVAQAIFLGINLISHSSVSGFKIAMSLFDLMAIAAIMLALRRNGMAPVQAIVFAWHPLVVWESAHSGHIESAAIAFLAAAVLAWSYEKSVLTGAAIAMATLVKFYPALLLPVFMISSPASPAHKGGRESWLARLRAICLNRFNLRMLAAFGATVVLAYLPYLSVGTGVTGYLEGYVREEGFVDSGQRYFLLRLVREVANVPAVIYAVLAALVLGWFALRALLSPKRSAIEVAGLGASMVGLVLVLSSPRYSWYIAWIIPFVCFVPRAGWLYLSGASVFLYLSWLTDESPGVPLWLGSVLYVPALVFLMWEHWKRPSAAVSGS
jgi:alpha-1,6-mannosyltransferase